MGKILNLALATLLAAPAAAGELRVSHEDAVAVAYRVWQNESGGRSEGLTHWNAGEGFASMGIGHFIWYPEGSRGPFQETFPGLLAFFEENGVALPAWLKGSPACPWADRESFVSDLHAERLVELRNLLTSTLDLQARYLAERLERALPAMLVTAPEERRELLARRFDAMLAGPKGLYALLDYVNFKGEGTLPTERYNGMGWGLLQVLLEMRGAPEREDGPAEFSRAARRVLARRVRNSPNARTESRWLASWRRRVLTYI